QFVDRTTATTIDGGGSHDAQFRRDGTVQVHLDLVEQVVGDGSLDRGTGVAFQVEDPPSGTNAVESAADRLVADVLTRLPQTVLQYACLVDGQTAGEFLPAGRVERE